METKNTRFSDAKSVQDFYKKPASRKALTSVIPVGTPPPQVFAMRPMPVEKKPVKACPDSLIRYITSSFLKCTNAEERSFIEQKLKAVIQDAKDKGLFYAQDWSLVQLPLLPREEAFMNSQASSKKAAEVLKPEPKPDVPKEVVSQERRKTKFSESKPRDAPIPTKVRKTEETSAPESKKPHKVVGTCTSLEKEYLRLTDEVDPSKVRPAAVLEKSLAHFKLLWKKRQIDYEYFSEQLRSIRQDMTVQGIISAFTVEVYQTHARLALEASDIDQFTSCLGRLNELYLQGLSGNRSEFLAYRIIYFALQQMHIHLEKCLKTLTDKDRSTSAIQHALQVKGATIIGNYQKVFHLRKQAPNMGSCLFDIFLPKFSVNALLKICKAYQPSVPLEFLGRTFGLKETECREFLTTNGAVLKGDLLICKESLANIRQTS